MSLSGSCWAFAATAAIESTYLIQNHGGATVSNLDLSSQHLVDCVNQAAGYGSNGCAGGSSDEVRNLPFSVNPP